MNDTELHQVLKVREEISEERAKIGTSIEVFQATLKQLALEVQGIRGISQEARERIRTSINETAQDMGESVAESIVEKIEAPLNDSLRDLEHIIQNARKAFETTQRVSKRKRVGILFLSWVCLFLLGVAGGIWIGQSEKSSNYYFSKADKLQRTNKKEFKRVKKSNARQPY